MCVLQLLPISVWTKPWQVLSICMSLVAAILDSTGRDIESELNVSSFFWWCVTYGSIGEGS